MAENIGYVRDGYKDAARIYREQKDHTQSEIPIFKTWLTKVNVVLELGCASGFPIGKAILETGKSYLGIDLSEEQIALAKKEFTQWSDAFIIAEMMEFVRESKENMYDGLISMFSIRHLPRIYHAELFTEIKRILKPGGFLLIDHPDYTDEGRGTWFGDLKMYWSSFSKEWQQLTLKELGFELVECYDDRKIFDGKEEITTFCIYKMQGNEI